VESSGILTVGKLFAGFSLVSQYSRDWLAGMEPGVAGSSGGL
jgi:hypothetical protein